MKVTIKEWVPVAVWAWDGCEDEVCGICRVSFDGTCPKCTLPGPECPPVVGKCTHAFHAHCIDQWLRLSHSGGTCPMCRQRFRRRDSPDVDQITPEMSLESEAPVWED